MDEADWKAFGEWVEQLRIRSGLQVGEVAERAEVSRVWLQEIRNGGRAGPAGWRLPNPKNEALVRLARALNVSPEELLARAGQDAGPSAAEAEGRPTPTSRREGASTVERIRELEERVAKQEQELAELRQLLQRQARRADVS